MNMNLRNIPFSPPDITEAEANEVREAILSGWITTGPKTTEFERLHSYLLSDQEGGGSELSYSCDEVDLTSVGCWVLGLAMR